MMKWPGGSLPPENMGILFAIGGKVRDVQADATAYVHRNANYIFEMECAWAPIDKKEVGQAQGRALPGSVDTKRGTSNRSSSVHPRNLTC